MTLIIDKKTESPLLDKVLVFGRAFGDNGKITKAGIGKELAKQMSVNEELVTVEHVYYEYGQQSTKVLACVYSNHSTKEFFKKKEKKAVAAGGA